MTVGQSIAQSAESLCHLVLYGLYGDAKLFGNLFVGEAVALAHQENLTTFFWQAVNSFPDSCIPE